MPDYQDFLPARRLDLATSASVAVSADGTQVAYTSDASGQFNVHVQPSGGGTERQLTFFTDHAVRQVAFTPDGSDVAFTADTQGDEQMQVYLVPADGGGEPVRLPGGEGRHYLAEKMPFDRQQRYITYSGPDPADPSVPDMIACELASGQLRRFAGPAYSNTFAAGISPDGRRVLAGVMHGNTDCQCYAAEVTAPGTAMEPVTAHLPGDYHYPGPWTGDSNGFYVLTTAADGEHVALARIMLDGRPPEFVDSPPWDVEDVAASADGRTVVWLVNQDGCSVLRARRDEQELMVPALPSGRVTAMCLSGDGLVLALLLDTPSRPTEVAVVHPGTSDPVRYLTDTRPPFFRNADPVTAEPVRFPSADGTLIPGLLYRPAGPGPYPVLVWVHGGPEVQARPQYAAQHQCLLANGVAVLVPNIRGSSGYGQAWQKRIYKDWGGVDLEDLAAAHGWLTAQPWCVPGKIAVYGGSYGGFVALSCLTRQPQLWAAGVSLYGPANLNTLATSMPPSWAGTIADHFGDPADPVVAQELARRSPLTYADQIRAPLLVIQGVNDPRVPRAESDQIIDAARANGADVEYIVFGDEGHGFTARDNNIKAYDAITRFLVRHLLS